MVKLNFHVLCSDLTVVYTLIVLCTCQQQNGIRRRITVDRYFIAIGTIQQTYYFYCTLIVVLSWPEDGRSRPKLVAKYRLIL